MVRRVDLFGLLNGLITVYKPPNLNIDKFLGYLKRQLSEEFNALPREPQLVRSLLLQSTDTKTKFPAVVTVPDIVDSDLVLGRRFVAGDFLLHPIDPLDDMSSGVQVLGIGEYGVYKRVTDFAHGLWLKTYHLTGMLGRASTDGTAISSTLIRSSWRHVTRQKLDRVLAGMQAHFRQSALLHSGLRPNTQAAYLALAKRSSLSDLRPVAAVQVETEFEDHEQVLSPWERHPVPSRSTLVNPAHTAERVDETTRRQMAPYVNSLTCSSFNPPFFTLEIQVAHETFQFLVDLVANLGPKLRSSTLLSSARRVRHGRFTTHEALLLKQCTVPTYVLDCLSQYLSEEANAYEPNDHTDWETVNVHLLRVLGRSSEDSSPHVFTNLYQCYLLHPPDLGVRQKDKLFLTPVSQDVA